VTDNEYRARAVTVADSFNDWPGLLGRAWIGDPAARRFGGICLFPDTEAAARSRTRPELTAGPLLTAVGRHLRWTGNEFSHPT
jgi:Putative mono-oxygenase ydhR